MRATVTEVEGALVVLDRGLTDGVQVGDLVLLATAHGERRALVRRVHLGTSTAELVGPAPGLEPGDEAVVLPPDRRVLERLDWEYGDVEHDPDAPLLAPLVGSRSEDRAPRWSGRIGVWYDTTFEGDGRDDHARGRARLDATGENPFGHGGTLDLDLRGEWRVTDAEGGHLSGDDDAVWIERASYAWGGTRTRPTRVEVGRFLHDELAQLGVLDGVDVSHRTSPGGRLGASAGFLPERDLERGSGEDLSGAVYYTHTGADADWRAGAALQQTWHDGEEDRRLAVAELDWEATPSWTAHLAAVVDFYDADDVAKDEGAELTELFASLAWMPRAPEGEAGALRPPTHGATLTAFRLRWPEALRDEVSPALLDVVADARVDRVALDAWALLGEDWRLSGRVDAWQDEEEDSGGGAELRLAQRGWLAGGEVWSAAYARESKFSDLTGVKLGASWRGERTSLRGSLDVARSEFGNFDGERAVLRLALERELGEGLFLSVDAERWLGDDEEATVIGFGVTRRF